MLPKMPLTTYLTAAFLAFSAASPASALTDWRKDGRLGYPSRDFAEAIALLYTAIGGPKEGLLFRIRTDPDGGFTPIFYKEPLFNGLGS